jgi:uncharacterized protein (DUF305 family)
MDSKPLLYGLIGFFLGGLLVSVAATTFDKPAPDDTEGMSMSQMTEDLRDKRGDDFDKAFINAMTLHHQGAVDMAALVGDRAKHQELKTLARDIVSSQSKEIDTMQTWRGEWGYREAPAAHNQNDTAH